MRGDIDTWNPRVGRENLPLEYDGEESDDHMVPARTGAFTDGGVDETRREMRERRERYLGW